MQHITNQLKGKTMKTEIDLTADIIDLRDIIERVEELENELADMSEADRESDKTNPTETVSDEYHDLHCELQTLTATLEELNGGGGDEKWRGDWYPLTLIRESHFTEYTREMLEECGTIPRDLPAWVHIDWEATAREVKMDYSYISIGEMDYLYR